MTLRRRLFALYAGPPLARLYTWLKFRILPFEEFSGALPPSGTIIDLGCGYGYLANYLSLAQPARRVIGLDTSEERIAAARRTIGDRANIEFVRGDIRGLAVPAADAILIADVLHHIPYAEQESVLRDAYAKLRAGGLTLIRETAKRASLRYWLLHCALEHALYAGQERCRFRTVGEWRRMLEAVGFTVERVLPNRPLSPYVTATFVCRK